MSKKLPTINIKGKEYVMVKDRIMAFNELYKGEIRTEIISNTEKSVVVKAIVIVEGREFHGHSEAYRSGNMGDVPVEVAETSAVGRALAMLGIGIIEGVASADEVVKASPRLATTKQKEYLKQMLTTKNIDIPKNLDSMTMDQVSQLIEKYKFKPKQHGANDRDFTPDIEGEKSIDYDPETGALK